MRFAFITTHIDCANCQKCMNERQCNNMIPMKWNIGILCHEWHHDIPFILNIKKALRTYVLKAFEYKRMKSKPLTQRE